MAHMDSTHSHMSNGKNLFSLQKMCRNKNCACGSIGTLCRNSSRNRAMVAFLFEWQTLCLRILVGKLMMTTTSSPGHNDHSVGINSCTTVQELIPTTFHFTLLSMQPDKKCFFLNCPKRLVLKIKRQCNIGIGFVSLNFF